MSGYDFLKSQVGKVQSSKQVNKKHFQNNSNEIDLWFSVACRMTWNASLYFYLLCLTHCVSWSGVRRADSDQIQSKSLVVQYSTRSGRI